MIPMTCLFSTRSLAAASDLALFAPSSLTMTFTGWPFTPPAALTEAAQVCTTLSLPPRLLAYGPVQAQMNPRTNGSPFAAVAVDDVLALADLDAAAGVDVLDESLSDPQAASVAASAATHPM